MHSYNTASHTAPGPGSRRLLTPLALLAAALISPAGVLAEDGWTELFNGKDLSGWTQLGGTAQYRVHEGAIEGLSTPSKQNTFLVTEKSYGDFILELEFKVDSKTNSGVQIRSESRSDLNNGRVHGYQIEIDPSPRAWTGGLYDEARRGWLYPLQMNPPAQRAFKADGWNTMKVECIGPSIRSWINGVPAAHVIDDMTPVGFIALQVHAPYPGGAEEDQKVWWRNIRVRTENLEPSTSGVSAETSPQIVNLLPNQLTAAEKELGWELLFDGTDAGAWRPVHGTGALGGRWSIEDGSLVVGGESSYSEGRDIVTAEEFEAFEFQLEFRTSKGANSGIKYLVTEAHHPDSSHGVGLEYQILDDARHPDAKGERGDLRKLGALYDLIEANKEGRFTRPPGQWNHARIVVKTDGQVEHWLNHRKVLEFNRSAPEFSELVKQSKYKDYEDFGRWPKGRVLLQDHGDRVEFRSIKIRRR